MGTIIMAGQLILALAILVSLHEWGHYIAARSFGIRVEKFYIFFDAWGVKLLSKQIGETEWGIGWLPLGGYVKITGMIDESLDKEQLASEPEDYEFRSKPAWQRLIVMIGGVTVNFILGILIFALSMFYYGETWLPNSKVMEKGGVIVTDLGKSAGFETGDKVLSINGQEVEKFRDLINSSAYISEGLNYGVVRNGASVTVPISDSLRTQVLESKGKLVFFSLRLEPIIGSTAPNGNAQKAGLLSNDKIVGIDSIDVEYFDQLKVALSQYKNSQADLRIIREGEAMTLTTEVDSAGMIGVQVSNLAQYTDDLQRTEYGFVESFPAGYNKGIALLKDNIVAFGEMFKGKLDPVKSVSGPVGIAKIFGAKWDWRRFWNITGMLSFILAFMNLLPIPALDGGHVLFLLVEMLRGKPLPEKVMYYFQVVGMVILFGLMGFIIFIDFFNAFFG